MIGAEIWIKILPVGQPTPTDPASFTFVALDTRTTYTLDFDEADGGKNANYLLRWMNPTGEKGPPALDGPKRAKSAVGDRRVWAACQRWSETATATIGA